MKFFLTVFFSLFILMSLNAADIGPKAATKQAPKSFKVKVTTTKGSFTLLCEKEWAPIGTDRFYNLIQQGFFKDVKFFRYVPGFVVQFGLAADPKISALWKDSNFKDDPVKQSNLEGYITFATSGPNTRTTQLFISLADNKRLDGMGFAPFGKVTEGMDVLKKLYSEYGETPDQGMIEKEGNKYLDKNFPKMDYIKEMKIIVDKK